ncbi:calcium-binding protein [Synechococcus sp. RedBA-s]|uniref:calcium-binding protein n=1 Tax=Synechococcus sp. RedBA-s TaxID=2823741 RepID=UPI0020CE1D0D|nr:calcium-binding protein [Synechococcus sp. RedBA-s]MCP9799185.1 hypothetical protein [Synechococcus sp. RedBA-s]
MAFTTLPGVDGAPTTFQGTEGADSIAIVGTDANALAFGSFVAQGEAGNDTINYSGTRTDSTIRGGQGDDLITQNIVGNGFLATSFVAGNIGNDTIGNASLGIAATLSTLQGGQGEDRIFAGTIQSTLVAGNLGADYLSVNDQFGFVSVDSSSIWGGQGDDIIEVTTSFQDSTVTNTSIAGNIGDDVINLDVFGSFAGSVADGGDGQDLIDATLSSSNLSLIGGTGDDTIFGGSGEDSVQGNDDDDWLAGSDGADVVDGGRGNDLITGSFYDGNVYDGDFTGDILSGGTGTNRFVIRDGSSGGFPFFNDLDGNGLITTGDSITTDLAGTADVITDWNSGTVNTLDTGISGLLSFNGFGNFMSLGFGIFNGIEQNNAVRGSYDDSTGNFFIDVLGSDIAVWSSEFAFGFVQNNVTILDGTGINFNTTITEGTFVTV